MGNLSQYHSQLCFVGGSDFQRKLEYVMDLYRLLSMTIFKAAQQAGTSVVKQSKDPLLSYLTYLLLQT